MPAATPLNVRKTIIQRREAGDTLAAIARELELPYQTVRNLWQHYQQAGHLRPNYDACRQTEVRSDPLIYERAVALKRTHPGWGAGLIWVELAEDFAEEALPSERTLQRWFHRAGGVDQRLTDRVRAGTVQRGQAVHEVWALDAKEQLRLLDSSWASWVALTDEASGAMLQAQAFPPEEVE